MTYKSAIRMTFISALACIGVLGATATGALATGTTGPAAGISFNVGSLGGAPSNCPSALTAGDAVFTFISGNAVSYGSTNSGGGNAEGTAQLTVGGTLLYQGHLHEWDGGSANAQGQMYFGETLSFQGTLLSDPTQSVTITASFGETIAAHKTTPTGWGHFKITCS